MLAQFQRSDGDGGAPRRRRAAAAARRAVSAAQQLAEVAEQPFVQRAMELFDVAPGQLRYTPPDERLQ